VTAITPAPEYLGIDHIQLTIPPGAEDEARSFYCGVLGLPEVEKPALLRARGGIWLRCGVHEIHLGVEVVQHVAEAFQLRESRRHPGIDVAALPPLRRRIKAAGIDSDVDHPPERPGFNRIHFRDPFGNGLEFMERAKA